MNDSINNWLLREEFYKSKSPGKRYAEVQGAFHQDRHNFPFKLIRFHELRSPGSGADIGLWALSSQGKFSHSGGIPSPLEPIDLRILLRIYQRNPQIYWFIEGEPAYFSESFSLAANLPRKDKSKALRAMHSLGTALNEGTLRKKVQGGLLNTEIGPGRSDLVRFFDLVFWGKREAGGVFCRDLPRGT